MKDIKIDEHLPYDKVSTYFKSNAGIVALFSLTGFCFDGLMAFVPIYLGNIIDLTSSGAAAQAVLTQGLLFIALVLFIQTNRFFKRYLVRAFANHMIYAMRKISFNYIVHSPLTTLNVHSKGDILNRNLTDIYDASEGVRKMTTEVFDTFVLIIGYFISLLVLDWKITLISLAFVALSVIIAHSIKGFVYKSVKNYKQYLSLTKDSALYSIKNETYYRGLGVGDYYNSQYEEGQNKLEKLAVKTLMLQSSLQPVYLIVAYIDLIFVIWLGEQKVIDGSWLIGTFSAYLTTYMFIAKKTGSLGKLVNAYQAFKVSWERCKIYLKHVPAPQKSEKEDASGLVISHLTFGFKPKETLQDISFSANPGEIIGLCGKVHSGKSTLLQAINGLFDYQGSVKLDGCEVRNIRKEEKDNAIGFCSSQAEIFQDDLEHNISLGHQEPIEEALYISHLEGDVKKKGEGEKEYLTRSVSNLSGGQQKRLMIARAVYRKPKLVLLDNPFESIDEEMSLEIINRIREKMPDSIVVLVSNQINILKCCTKLLYIEDWHSTFATYSELSDKKDFEHFLGGQGR
jgi:ATP-binding cassette, subfamily B, multidrug efflux pump